MVNDIAFISLMVYGMNPGIYTWMIICLDYLEGLSNG